MKRVLLVFGFLVLLVGGAFVAFQVLSRRGLGTGITSPRPTTATDFPTGADATPVSTVPGADAPLSVACPETWVGLPDADADGLPDAAEAFYHTDDRRADTDADGHNDGEEVRAGYQPLKREGNPRLDSDSDGLLDNEECQWKTDLARADTDGDGFPDGAEVRNGFDPTIRGDGRGSDALPARRAQQAEQALEQLRPAADAPNYTEGVAGLLTQGKPIREIGQTRVTPQQVQTILNQARLETTLPAVSIAEVTVGKSNTPEAVRVYLQNIDQLHPRDLTDPATVTHALTAALGGDVSRMRTLRARLTAYEQSLASVETPPSAVEYQKTLLALTRFVNEKFRIVEVSAATDPAKTFIALRELQEGLGQHAQKLQETRAKLDEIR